MDLISEQAYFKTIIHLGLSASRKSNVRKTSNSFLIYTKISETATSLVNDSVTAAGFEVLPVIGSVHSACRDDHRIAELMSLVTEIANEKGLDSQNYQCRGCGRNIGESSITMKGFAHDRRHCSFCHNIKIEGL